MNQDQTRLSHSVTFPIFTWDAGPKERAGVGALMRYIQEAAKRHTDALNVGYDSLAPHNLFWALVRFSIRIDRLPRWTEEVTVTTWPCGEDRLLFFRRFKIVDSAGAPIAEAASSWVMVNAEKRRFIRTSDSPIIIPAIDLDHDRSLKAERLPPLKTPEPDGEFRVNFSDLDLVAHVNNVRYAEWVIDSLPTEFLFEHIPVRLDINYQAEALCGDKLLYAGVARDELSFDHLIFRPDGSAVARARTSWAVDERREPER